MGSRLAEPWQPQLPIEASEYQSLLFRAVGFPIERPTDISALHRVAAAAGQWLEADGGFYVHWGPDNGCEYWAATDNERNVIWTRPHYFGDGRLRMTVAHAYPTVATSLAGQIKGRVDPDDRVYESYSASTDLSGFGNYSGLFARGYVNVMLQVAALVEMARIHSSEREYLAQRPRRGLDVGDWVPIDVSSDGPSPSYVIGLPRGWICGTVTSAELKSHPFGGRQFWAIRTKIIGGTVDVVADAAAITQAPQPDNIVVASAFFCAQGHPDQVALQYGLPVPNVEKMPRAPIMVQFSGLWRDPKTNEFTHYFPRSYKSYFHSAVHGFIHSLVAPFTGVSAISGFILCWLALRGMNATGNPRGRGLAVAGMVICISVLAIIVLLLVAIVLRA